MDNLEINSLDRSPNASFLMRQEVETKRCPQCQSIYITDEACEGCGLQLNVDLLGGPLSDRSYFNLKQDYQDSLGPFSRTYPLLERLSTGEKKRRFHRKILYRFKDILLKFNQILSISPKIFPIYKLELEQIIETICESKKARMQLKRTLEDFGKKNIPYSGELLNLLNLTIKENKKKHQKMLLKFFVSLLIGYTFITKGGWPTF